MFIFIKSLYTKLKIKISNKFFGSRLGGNLGKTNIDNQSLEYLIQNFNIKSFLDIGCGKGGMVFNAINKGLFARGIEGDLNSIPIDCPLIYNVDYRDSNLNSNRVFDLGWSIEVLEHIPEKYLHNVFKDFKNCRYVVFTAAPPGWGGVGHVNEKDEEYWIDRFIKQGFIYDKTTTKEIRRISQITFGGLIRDKKKQFLQNRGLFFINNNLK